MSAHQEKVAEKEAGKAAAAADKDVERFKAAVDAIGAASQKLTKEFGMGGGAAVDLAVKIWDHTVGQG